MTTSVNEAVVHREFMEGPEIHSLDLLEEPSATMEYEKRGHWFKKISELNEIKLNDRGCEGDKQRILLVNVIDILTSLRNNSY